MKSKDVTLTLEKEKYFRDEMDISDKFSMTKEDNW